METRPVELMSVFVIDAFGCSFPEEVPLSPLFLLFVFFRYVECSESEQARA